MTRNIALLLLGLAVVTTMMVAGENGPLTQMAASKPDKPTTLASVDKAADSAAPDESEVELAEAWNDAANEDFAAAKSQKKAPVFAEFKLEESKPPVAEATAAPQLAKAPAKERVRSSSYNNSLMAAGHVDYSFNPVLEQEDGPET